MGGSTPSIPGQKITGADLWDLRNRVAQLLDRSNTGFPGAQPVSFAARHKIELQKQDYFVCEKSDGIRCLMFLTNDPNMQEATFLIDRKNDYYLVPDLHFPKSAENPEPFHTDTILDGELVNDTIIDPDLGARTQLMYLVFDCLVLNGDRLMHQTLDKRIGHFTEFVYNPYKKLYDRFPGEREHLPFLVDWKMMERGYGIEKMFKETLPKLPHGNDGLIFTCRTTPYQFGTDQHILKWKPAQENSVDFRMTLDFPMVEPDTDDEDQTPYPDYTALPQVKLSVHGGDRDGDIPYGAMYLTNVRWEELKALKEPLNDRIVECCLMESNIWSFLRFRDDKQEANHISTVESVMESILDKVSEEDLIEASKSIRDEWKKRERETEAQKAAMARAATNGHASQSRNANLGAKRKFEGDDPANGFDGV